MGGRFMAEVAAGAAKDFAEAGDNAAQTISKKLLSDVADTEESAVDRTLATDAERATKISNIMGDASGGTDTAAADVEANAGSDASSAATSAESGAGAGEFGGGDSGGQGSEGDGPTPDCKDPIDPVSGQMMTAKADVELGGVLPLILRRAYASGYRHGRLFGPGWSSTLDQRLVIDADGIHFLGDDAQTLNYGVPTQHGQRMLPTAGARWPLTWDRTTDTIAVLDPASGLTRYFTAADSGTDGAHGAAGGAAGAETEVRHLARITDRNGNWLTVTRDVDGVPSQVDHVGGYRIAVDTAYRGTGFRVEALRLIDAAHPEGVPLVGYSYDPAGRLVEILDANNVPLIYEYDDVDRITAWIDRGGYRYDYEYDDSGRIARVGGEDGTLGATFEYDLEARCTRVVDSYAAVTEYWYDEHNHLIRLVDPAGNATLMSHDRFGRLLEHTDPLGNTTRFVRDETGNVRELQRADGTRVLAEYNEFQQPTRITAPSGAVSVLAYDERGNLATSTDPSASAVRYTYDEHGALISATDPLGNTTAISTDRAGLPLAITDPLGSVWTVARDAHGRVVRSTDPLGNVTTTEYDADGRPVARTTADGAREMWSYDTRGNLVRHVNPAGFETTFDYGPFRTILSRTDPDGSRYQFTHDRELRLTAVTNPSAASWIYEYDDAGNLVAEQDFNGRRLGYAYDAAGRLAQRVNGAGETVDLVRNALGHVIEQHLPDQRTATFEYDVDGALIRAANQDARLEFTRDATGRAIAETVEGRTLSRSYDALGNRISRSTPSGHASSWAYDAAGRPVSLTTSAQQISFGHDAAGRESHRWLSASTALTNEWDQLGRLTSRKLLAVTGPDDARISDLIHERTWTYRADGNPDSVADSQDGTRVLTLDPLGRVTAVNAATWSEQYAYDALGNLTHAADSRNADAPTAGARELSGTLLRQAGHTSYEYDAQGRLVKTVRRTLSGGRKVWTYAYDAFDRMVEAQTPDSQRWTYTYDALGRRIAKQLVAEDGQIREQTRFTWDGASLAEQEHTRAGRDEVTTTAWDYEPGTWTPVAQDRRTYYAHAPQEVIDQRFHAIVTDLIGTPTELVTPEGEIAWRRSAGLWGNRLPAATAAGTAATASDAAADCPLRFPGQYHDAETGLDYNYRRYYDPDTGRYTAPDPLGLIPAPNHHTYVANPLFWLDPFGLSGGTYYRGSKAGQPVTFTAKPNEFKVDPKTGIVKPTHGVSLFDNEQSIAGKGFEPNEVDPESVPDTLQIKQRGNDPKHFEIMPADEAKLTPEQYQNELSKLKTKSPTIGCE